MIANPEWLRHAKLEELKQALYDAENEEANLWDERQRARERFTAADRAWVGARDKLQDLREKAKEAR